MPNWVQNSLHVYASDKGKQDNVYSFFDEVRKAMDDNRPEVGGGLFNHFVPMPDIYRKYDLTNHDPSSLKIGDRLYLDVERDDESLITKELIAEWKAVKKVMQDEYGAVGWYDWSCKYWGTKWDVYADGVSIGHDYLEFQTAWSCPHEFLLALSKLKPELRFVNWYSDEDYSGENCGVTLYENGKCREFNGSTAFAFLHWNGYEEDFEYYFDEMNKEVKK